MTSKIRSRLARGTEYMRGQMNVNSDKPYHHENTPPPLSDSRSAFCAQALAQLSPGNPLAGLEKLKDFEAMRASSCDKDWRNGNGDARPIEPGGTLVLADLKGPGMITHFWNTIAHQAPVLLAAADAADLLGRREAPQRRVPDRRFLRHRPRAGQVRSSRCRSRSPPKAAGGTATGRCRSASRPASP